MTTVTVLPHAVLCPAGLIMEIKPGQSLCDALLENDIEIEHACEQACACTTCHVLIREGFDSLEPADDLEEDMLDKAWGLSPVSRLSCQAFVGESPLTIEIPKYTVNMARETPHQ